MNVLLHMPKAQQRMGGGALSMFRTAEQLEKLGASVRITATIGAGKRVRNHVVMPFSSLLVRWADVVFTAPRPKNIVARNALAARRPVVSFVHSASTATAWVPTGKVDATLIVWGSAALEARVRAQGFRPICPTLVLWPPIDEAAVTVQPTGKCVTLVNLIPEKGARLFWQIVEQMSDVPFLGVLGGWGRNRQVVPSPLPGNATVMPFTPRPCEVYERTRVLLYMRGVATGADWLNGVGLAAVEAACSGIPTVAHPGPGLVESLGAAGTWVDSDDPVVWAAKIRQVLQPSTWVDCSVAARAAAAHACKMSDVNRLLDAIKAVA